MGKTGAFIFHRGQNVRRVETIETIMIVRYSIAIVIKCIAALISQLIDSLMDCYSLISLLVILHYTQLIIS